ncbi:MAG: DEAD/DEAH box helicase, partial [Pseudomonadota bacterium]
KPHAQFTNLVAEPGVETTVVADAVNDMLKAISGAMLMEQVLAPNFKFYRREDGDIRAPVETTADGKVHIGIKGLMEPPTARARTIVENDMQELVAKACQAMDRRVVADDVAPEVATQMVLTDIIEKTYETLTDDETEAVRQDLAARMNLIGMAKREAMGMAEDGAEWEGKTDDEAPGENLSLMNMVKRFVNVRELDIDLIDSVNPFKEGFDVASRAFDTPLLKTIQEAMISQRIQMTEKEALVLWPRIKRFRSQEGREPNPHAADPLEKRLAEAHAYIKTKKAERQRAAQAGA